MRISHESIYRFIEHRVRVKDYTWHKLLPQAKFYRGWRPRKGGPPSKTFTDYVSIDDRPEAVEGRKSFGHWEADFMAFRHNTEVILVAHERKSRMKFAWVQPNKGAEAVRIKMCEHLLALTKKLCRSITYDNGTEFAQHHLINKATGAKSYFCHTHSPWQKDRIRDPDLPSMHWLKAWIPASAGMTGYLSRQIPQTEFSKRGQFDGKVIGIKTDGAACDMKLNTFLERQRGTEISVY